LGLRRDFCPTFFGIGSGLLPGHLHPRLLPRILVNSHVATFSTSD
jgi:hypothetical protein